MFKIRSGTTKFSYNKRTKPIKTLLCIGSGGHTTEILKLTSSLDHNLYKPRRYIMADNDISSETKIDHLENNVYKANKTHYEIVKIPRSRIVGQSYFSSIFSTLYSILYCIPIVARIKPELILCNGPGTCIPICLVAFAMRLFFISDCRIVFIESICRVKSFSLSGKILMYFADNIVVHWEDLLKFCKRADYLGQLF